MIAFTECFHRGAAMFKGEKFQLVVERGDVSANAPDRAKWFSCDPSGLCGYWSTEPEWFSGAQGWVARKRGSDYWPAGELALGDVKPTEAVIELRKAPVKWPEMIDNPFLCDVDNFSDVIARGEIKKRAPKGARYFTIDPNTCEATYWKDRPTFRWGHFDGDIFVHAGEIDPGQNTEIIKQGFFISL